MGKGSGGGNSVQTSTTSSPPPQVLANYNAATTRAQNVSNAPYQPYPGNIVAPFSDIQNQSFGYANAPSTAFYQAAPTAEAAYGNAGTAYGNAGTAFGAAGNAYGNAGQALQAAAQNYGASTTPIYQTVGNYLSPYTQDVVNATAQQFNNQNRIQQAGIVGNAVSQNAWGGDRSAIAQAIAAGQEQAAQAPVLAGLYNTGYQTALGANEAQNWLYSQAGSGLAGIGSGFTNIGGGYGNIGSGYNNAGAGYTNLGQGITGFGVNAANVAGGQLGNFQTLGAQEQAQAQANLNVPYQQYIAAQAYPFQTSQFYTNAVSGLGSLTGGQSTTTAPGPSAVSGIGGLLSGAAGIAGLFLAKGGRVDPAHGVMPVERDVEARPMMIGIRGIPHKLKMAEGGIIGYRQGERHFADAGVISPFYPNIKIPDESISWVPTDKGSLGPGPPAPPQVQSQPQQSLGQSLGGIDFSKLSGIVDKIKGKGNSGGVSMMTTGFDPAALGANTAFNNAAATGLYNDPGSTATFFPDTGGFSGDTGGFYRSGGIVGLRHYDDGGFIGDPMLPPMVPETPVDHSIRFNPSYSEFEKIPAHNPYNLIGKRLEPREAMGRDQPLFNALTYRSRIAPEIWRGGIVPHYDEGGGLDDPYRDVAVTASPGISGDNGNPFIPAVPATLQGLNPEVQKFVPRESGGKPFVGYTSPETLRRTGKFTDLSDAPVDETGAPVWSGDRGPKGISTAFGPAQITRTTWQPIAKDLGITDWRQPGAYAAVANELYRRAGDTPWAASAPAGGIAPRMQLAQANGGASDASPLPPPPSPLSVSVTQSPGMAAATMPPEPKKMTGMEKLQAQGINPWLALAIAGFSTAAGRSPFAMQNIGAGFAEGAKYLAQGPELALKQAQARKESAQAEQAVATTDLLKAQVDYASKHQGDLVGGIDNLTANAARELKSEAAAPSPTPAAPASLPTPDQSAGTAQSTAGSSAGPPVSPAPPVGSMVIPGTGGQIVPAPTPTSANDPRLAKLDQLYQQTERAIQYAIGAPGLPQDKVKTIAQYTDQLIRMRELDPRWAALKGQMTVEAENPGLIARSAGQAAAEYPYREGAPKPVTQELPSGEKQQVFVTPPRPGTAGATPGSAGVTPGVSPITTQQPSGVAAQIATTKEDYEKNIYPSAEKAQPLFHRLQALEAAGQDYRTSNSGQFRLEVGRTYLDFLQMLGIPVDQKTAQSIASGEVITKEGNLLGFDLSRQQGAREAAQVVSMAISSNPGIMQTPQGNRALVSLMRAQAQADVDRRNFYDSWVSDPTHAGSFVGAQKAWETSHPAEAYVNTALHNVDPNYLPKPPPGVPHSANNPIQYNFSTQIFRDSQGHQWNAHGTQLGTAP